MENVNAVKEKIDEVLELCQLYRIPMFVTIAEEDNADGTKYYNRMYSAKAHGIQLADDKIEKHVLIASGFSAVPPRDALELDMSAVLSGFDFVTKD